MIQQPRFLALDILRGMTVCFMIIVNTPGSGAEPFSPLLHAAWHGFTPTDLVFPSFLFAVGNAMAFTMDRMQSLSAPKVIGRVSKRAAIIFLLGYLMYWFPFVQQTPEGWSLSPISQTRILGVLQRIALCYLAASLMIRFLSEKIVHVVAIVLLIGYWILMTALGDYTLQGNLALHIDKQLLGDAHLYHGEGVVFDPEGLLSTLPAIVNVLAGYFAGVFVRRAGNNYETLTKLMLTGALLVAIAYFWNNLFPINKKLWTSSFVLYTSGLDLLLLATLIYLIDIQQKRTGTRFFEVFGKNPLFIYLLSEILAIALWSIPVGEVTLYQEINTRIFQSLLPGAWGSLCFALTFMLTCWLAGLFLHVRKIYIKV